jgi:hypothetical protein
VLHVRDEVRHLVEALHQTDALVLRARRDDEAEPRSPGRFGRQEELAPVFPERDASGFELGAHPGRFIHGTARSEEPGAAPRLREIGDGPRARGLEQLDLAGSDAQHRAARPEYQDLVLAHDLRVEQTPPAPGRRLAIRDYHLDAVDLHASNISAGGRSARLRVILTARPRQGGFP